ncbi:hypothetical protein DIU36_21220 [Mucilaginibacter rubeus]|nr:hypothetical protein [Mucilaginibacter rubeus]RAV54153.1 hypothetical protein DIU36_21220 [Mucilaginibacter rubeus]
MNFEIKSEYGSSKVLAQYLCYTLPQLQAIINAGTCEYFEQLKPITLDYEGSSRAIICDIIKHQDYTMHASIEKDAPAQCWLIVRNMKPRAAPAIGEC